MPLPLFEKEQYERAVFSSLMRSRQPKKMAFCGALVVEQQFVQFLASSSLFSLRLVSRELFAQTEKWRERKVLKARVEQYLRRHLPFYNDLLQLLTGETYVFGAILVNALEDNAPVAKKRRVPFPADLRVVSTSQATSDAIGNRCVRCDNSALLWFDTPVRLRSGAVEDAIKECEFDFQRILFNQQRLVVCDLAAVRNRHSTRCAQSKRAVIAYLHRGFRVANFGLRAHTCKMWSCSFPLFELVDPRGFDVFIHFSDAPGLFDFEFADVHGLREYGREAGDGLVSLKFAILNVLGPMVQRNQESLAWFKAQLSARFPRYRALLDDAFALACANADIWGSARSSRSKSC